MAEQRNRHFILGQNSKAITSATVVINLLAGSTGVCLNSIVALYYLQKPNRGKTVPFLYTIMSICNIITCILAILQATALILDMTSEENILFDYESECLIVSGYMIYSVVTRGSMLHNLVLSVVRSINIQRPFQRISWRAILPVFATFYAVWLTIGTLDVIDLGGKHGNEMSPVKRKVDIQELFRFPQPGQGTCFFLNIRSNRTLCNTDTHPGIAQEVTFSLMMLFMIVPAVIMFLASLHQCWIITKKGRKRSKVAQVRDSTSSKLTVTILILSSICLITKGAYETFYFSVYVARTSHKYNRFQALRGAKVVTYYFSTVIHVLHAVLEPLVFISRGEKLRDHLLTLVRRLESAKFKSATRDLQLKEI